MAEVTVGHQRQVAILSILSLFAGAFLAVSPLLNHYDFSSGKTSVNVALGVLIFGMAYFRATFGGGTPWVSWVLIALGVLVLGTPWWMKYAFDPSFKNQHLIVGGIVCAAEFINAINSHMFLAKNKK
jgi:hypothetical protein